METTLPDNAQIRDTLKKHQVRLYKQDLTQSLSDPQDFEIAAIVNQLQEIQRLSPQTFSDNKKYWSGALAQHI